MAQNTNKVLVAGSWRQLTNADVTSITFQNRSSDFILIKGTTSASAPTDDDGAIRYNPGQGERNVFLSELFPGIAAVRVYAYAPADAKASPVIMVSHA